LFLCALKVKNMYVKAEPIFLNSAHEYTKVVSNSNRKWSADALNHESQRIVKLCRLSRKADLYEKNVRCLLHDTCNTRCHYHASVCWSSERTSSFPFNTRDTSHDLKTFTLNETWAKCLFYCISFRAIDFVLFIFNAIDLFYFSDNKFVAFPNFVIDCGRRLKFALVRFCIASSFGSSNVLQYFKRKKKNRPDPLHLPQKKDFKSFCIIHNGIHPDTVGGGGGGGGCWWCWGWVGGWGGWGGGGGVGG
jgi:hypothetical protein